MLYCRHCKVNIAGRRIHCPLCGGDLTGEADISDVYPDIPNKLSYSKRAMQIISASALVASVICVAVNLLIPTKIFWALFAVFGLFCGWLWAMIGIAKKSVVINNIVWQLVLISLCALLWDCFTGWRGWSVDFVLPCVCFGAMLAIIVLSRVMHIPGKGYTFNLIVCAVIGLIPLILLLTGVLHIIIPSIICTASSLIVIILLFIFRWRTTCREIQKKLHL